MSKNQSGSIIVASMLVVAMTLFLSKGWAGGFFTFIEEKINNPDEPLPASPGGSGQSGFDPNAGSGQGAGGGGGSSW